MKNISFVCMKRKLYCLSMDTCRYCDCYCVIDLSYCSIVSRQLPLSLSLSLSYYLPLLSLSFSFQRSTSLSSMIYGCLNEWCLLLLILSKQSQEFIVNELSPYVASCSFVSLLLCLFDVCIGIPCSL